jgi:hypothetical protein
MANYLVLGGNYSYNDPHYRGTHRFTPYHYDAASESHEVNQAFLWYCEAGGQTGIVHDLAKVFSLVEAYRSVGQNFDVVEVKEGVDAPCEHDREFLGVDISCGYNTSLLCWGLKNRLDDSTDPTLRRISPLIALIECYFKPKLNGNVLFDEVSDARKCLECMMALQDTYPGLWESKDSQFVPVILYLRKG